MILTLDVTGPPDEKPAATRQKVFDRKGGSIGRKPDNTLVLPNVLVSSRHAIIRFRDGRFYIEDVSTNGIVVNADKRLVKGRPFSLSSGDRIFIKPYDIQVSITDEMGHRVDSHAAVPAPDLFASDAALMARELGSADVRGGAPGIDPRGGASADELDPLKLLGGDPRPTPVSPGPRAEDLRQGSALSGHYRSPDVRAAEGVSTEGAPRIPDDYDPAFDTLSGRAVRAQPEPGPRVPAPSSPPPAPESRSHRARPKASPASASEGPDAAVALGEVLAGAGLDRLAVTPELAQDLGRILRAVVSGVMDVLQARQEVKDEFRMPATRFKTVHNNPLKFSANVNDALDKLLVKRNTAYLGPVDAFEDAFNDLRNHQVAMLAGVRAAFESLLAEFDPDRLQAQFDRPQKKGSLMSVASKPRYWDLYRSKVEDMTRDPDTSFRTYFGEKFVEAYEEQLRRLAEQNKSGKS